MTRPKAARLCFLALCGALAINFGIALAQPSNMEAIGRVEDTLDKAESVMRGGDLARGYTIIKDLIASDTYDEVPEVMRGMLHTLAGAAGMMNNQVEAAHRSFVIATELAGADDGRWRGRMDSAVASDNLQDAVASLMRIALRWPEAIDSLDRIAVNATMRAARRGHPESSVYMDLMEALARIPPQSLPPMIDQNVWPYYIATLIERGDIAQAVAVTNNVVFSTQELVGMSLDSRFAPLYDPLSRKFDLSRSMASELQMYQEEIQAHPDRLLPLYTYSQLLRFAGLHDEALAVFDDLPRPLELFSGWEDEDAELAAAIDEIGAIYWDLGRHEEAIAVLERARRIPQNGWPNVSQTINLAIYQALSDQPEQSLATLELVAGTSPFGDMVAGSARLYAAVQADDEAALQSALSYLADNRFSAMHIYRSSLLLTGRLDEAAQTVIDMLNSEVNRTVGLRLVQHYINDDDLSNLTLIERLVMQNQLVVNARDDVREAVNKVGRQTSLPFFR